MKNSFRSSKNFSRELVVASELYDYSMDPDETVNIVQEEKYKNLARELDNKLVGFFKSEEQKLSNRKSVHPL
jgi:hypothetical protein